MPGRTISATHRPASGRYRRAESGCAKTRRNEPSSATGLPAGISTVPLHTALSTHSARRTVPFGPVSAFIRHSANVADPGTPVFLSRQLTGHADRRCLERHSRAYLVAELYRRDPNNPDRLVRFKRLHTRLNYGQDFAFFFAKTRTHALNDRQSQRCERQNKTHSSTLDPFGIRSESGTGTLGKLWSLPSKATVYPACGLTVVQSVSW